MEKHPRWHIRFAAALILAHSSVASAQSWKLIQAAGGSTTVTVTSANVSIDGPSNNLEIPVARIVEVSYNWRLLNPVDVIEQWPSQAHSILNDLAESGDDSGGAALLAVGVLAFASVEALTVPEHRVEIVWLDPEGVRTSTTIVARTPMARALFDRLRNAVATRQVTARR